MSDEIQERLIHVLAAALAWGLGHLLAERFLKKPKERGVADDAKEALVKAATSAASTIAASVIIRRVV